MWPSQEQMNFNSGSLARWTKLEPGEMEIFNFLWLIWDYRDQGGLSFYAGAKDKHSALMLRLAMYSETQTNLSMLKNPCLPLKDTLY